MVVFTKVARLGLRGGAHCHDFVVIAHLRRFWQC
jgi:hypothetical protein